MGLFDKIKDAAIQTKEGNRNFISTTKRINTFKNLYGRINTPNETIFKLDPNDDFCKSSYISIEEAYAVIYGTAQDDYLFTSKDVKSFESTGENVDIFIGDKKYPGERFNIEFNDGKKAKADIFSEKLDVFKIFLGIK